MNQPNPIDGSKASEPSSDHSRREVVSAGGVVINERGEILFCHPTHSRWTNWRMPKGLVDPGESLRDAALREVLEETGWQCEIVHELKTKPRYDTKSGRERVWKTLHLFLMRPIAKIQEPDWEHDAFRWVPMEKVESYASDKEREVIAEACKFFDVRQA